MKPGTTVFPVASMICAPPSAAVFADGEDARARDEDFLRTERFRCEDVATADHREERVVTYRGHVDRRLHVERDAQPCGEDRAIDGSIDRLGRRGKLCGSRAGAPGDAGGHGSPLRRTLTPRTSHHSRRWSHR